jgi:hypothetical protein
MPEDHLERLWSRGIATTMLWGVRNAIDIPATPASAEHVYKGTFTAFCVDFLNICLGAGTENRILTAYLVKAGIRGRAIEIREEELRLKLLASLGRYSKQLFPGEEGLDRLSVASGSSSTSSKRKVSSNWIALITIKKRKRRK